MHTDRAKESSSLIALNTAPLKYSLGWNGLKRQTYGRVVSFYTSCLLDICLGAHHQCEKNILKF